MRKFIFIFSIALFLVFQACEKKEKLYTLPPIPTGTQISNFDMGSNYENQIWYQFSTQKTLMNFHETWEIGFSNSENPRIVLNCGKNQEFSVAVLPNGDFNDFTTCDVTKLKWQIDNPRGMWDSLVMKDWCAKGSTGTIYGNDMMYLLDRGKDLGALRFVKFKMESRIGGIYHFNWSYIQDTTSTHDIYLNASNPNYNYTYYSFGDENLVVNEMMEKDQWDIVFTTYKKFIPDPNNGNAPYPYILRGVITNPAGVNVLEIPISIYDNLNLDFVKTITWSSDLDEIGYDWKIWNMSANKYTMSPKAYILKDIKGNYIKLKFVDFYDDNGNKGHPKMAWEYLK